MQENNFFNGLFQPKNQLKGTNLPPQRTRYQQLLFIFCFVGVLLYPFSFMGAIPLLVVKMIDKKDKAAHVYDMDYESFLKQRSSLFFILAFIFTLLNLFCFIFVIPRGYLSCYLLFPLNMFPHTLQFNAQTIFALLLGGAGAGSCLIAYASFIEKRKVVSKKERQLSIQNSKEYKERRKNKFQESQKYTAEYQRVYQVAVAIKDVALRNEKLASLAKIILLGTDEYGLAYMMNFSELNQHVIIPATTGSGKTTLIQLLAEHACKFRIPVILVDGKGAGDTLKALKEVAEAYKRPFEVFVDGGDLHYNPVKNGNDIAVRDKLTNLAETESVYYSTAAKALLQVTIQLLDEFQRSHKIERNLVWLQHYLLPRNVLHLFADRIQLKNPDLFKEKVTVKVKPSKKKEKKQKESEDKLERDFSDVEQLSEEQIIKHDRTTVELETYYLLLKKNIYLMTKNEQTLFKRLFVRYEHKKNPFYLYATSENLQTNINMLLDSELGELFDTSEGKRELDIQEVVKEGKIVYISLNGLIYSEFIRTLAQMLIGDINFFASEVYKQVGEIATHSKVLVIFDEPASYLNDKFIDLVNKGRGAGVHAVYAPQTLADIDKIDPILRKQLIGNVNTFFIGKTNDPTEIDYWADLMGTEEDIELTEMITQEAGYSDMDKVDWTGEKGTKREVDRFKFNPNRIRALRKGEFVVYRTAEDVHEPPRVVYIRKANL
ncbi:TraM recognition domain-containing protein [Enterococcus hirae]|uniref:TraM recognition domain-containing protein n=1 Tax=Enterococcus hirae TaxID=1354 RepID=UPI001377A08D|nr:DUF853 family protein [Enterococcus hirae]